MPLKSGASVCLYSVLWPWQWQWVVPVLDSGGHGAPCPGYGHQWQCCYGPWACRLVITLAHTLLTSPTFTWNYYVVNICCIVAMIILLGCPSNMRWLTVYSNVNLKSHFTLKWTQMVSTLFLKLTKKVTIWSLFLSKYDGVQALIIWWCQHHSERHQGVTPGSAHGVEWKGPQAIANSDKWQCSEKLLSPGTFYTQYFVFNCHGLWNWTVMSTKPNNI